MSSASVSTGCGSRARAACSHASSSTSRTRCRTSCWRSASSTAGRRCRLRNAQAKLAVLDAYDEREELGEIHADATATMNERRLDVARAAEKMRAELERHRGSRRALRGRQGHLAPAARRGAPRRQRARRGLLRGDAGALARPHPRRRAPGEPVRLSRRLRAAAVAAQGRLLEGAGDRGLPRDADGARLRPRGRQEHPHRPRGPPAEDAAARA